MAPASRRRGWADELARIATELRFESVLVASPPDDPVGSSGGSGEEAAPRRSRARRRSR